MKRTPFVFAMIQLSVIVLPVCAQTRTLEIDDTFRIAGVGDPAFSPEGEWIAYTVGTTDLEEETRETRIWMVDVNGTQVLPMTGVGSSASRPRFSPDGKYLSFLASRNGGKSQVWVLNRVGGEAQQLTRIEQGVQSYEWAPDGSKLLLTIRDPETDSTDTPQPWVIDRLQFKRDYTGYLTDDRRSHLYVWTLADSSLKQVTEGEYDASQPTWSPDGRLVAFVANRTEEPDANGNSDIWLVDTQVDDAPSSVRQLTTNPGSDGQPAFSPDGRWIAYVTVIAPEIIWYATSHLAVISLDGGEPALLTTELDRNVDSPVFSQNGRYIYFGLEDSGARHVARIHRNGGAIERPVAGDRRAGPFTLGPRDNVASVISEPHLPGELFVKSGSELVQITRTNQDLFSGLSLGEVRNVTFPSADGTEIEGFIFTPPDYEPATRYPTLLRIHGGPVSQYDFGFKFEAQLLAANGYVVILTNPRGSSGYGQEFSLGIWQSWGVKDFEDVMAGVDYAISEGYADPDRLGVGGWSYGGILTNYVITQTDRFKAAISGASEVLYVANYGHDHYQRQWEAELGLPWENRELWERLSPFNRVENIVTPTLLMGGEKDWNVPILNSEQLYQALRRLGRTTQLVVYPDEHHGIRRPAFQRDRYERYLSWYSRFLMPEDPVF